MGFVVRFVQRVSAPASRSSDQASLAESSLFKVKPSSWLPARQAQRLPLAQSLKGLGLAAAPERRQTLGLALLALGGLLALMPPIAGVPLAAYVSVALLLVGGYSAYRAAHGLLQQRANHPEFRIPLVCLPATIDNDLPGSDLSIGTDTALNNIVDAVDKIKQSAVASRRVMVVEVMGRYCGYLALMAGMATGAERVYLHEQGVHLAELQADVQAMASGFKQDKKLGLIIRNEYCNAVYDTRFMWRLFAEEGRGIFEARYAILGHLQQGGDPSPFDRIQATRLATRCLDYIYEQGLQAEPAGAFIGLRAGQVQFTPLAEFPAMMDAVTARPREQWWLALLPVLKLMAQAGPQSANIPQD
ncbi:MAG: hypothetical protein RL334_1622 [Chloroflexota bacterium]